jgi:hypothetical protein
LRTAGKSKERFENNEKCDLVWGNWEFFNQDFKSLNMFGPVTIKVLFDNNQDALSHIASNNHTLPSATFISKYVLDATGYPNDRLKMLCDREFFIRIISNSRKCQSLPFVVCNYRISSEGVSSNFTRNFKIYEFALNFENLLSNHLQKYKLVKTEKKKLSLILLNGLLKAKKQNNIDYQNKISGYLNKLPPSMFDLIKFKVKVFILDSSNFFNN